MSETLLLKAGTTTTKLNVASIEASAARRAGAAYINTQVGSARTTSARMVIDHTITYIADGDNILRPTRPN